MPLPKILTASPSMIAARALPPWSTLAIRIAAPRSIQMGAEAVMMTALRVASGSIGSE